MPEDEDIYSYILWVYEVENGIRRICGNLDEVEIVNKVPQIL